MVACPSSLFRNAGPLFSSFISFMSRQSSMASSIASHDVFPSNEGGISLSSSGKIDSIELCRVSTLPASHTPHHKGLTHICVKFFCHGCSRSTGALLLSSPFRWGTLGVPPREQREELRYHVEIGPSVNYLITVYCRQASGRLFFHYALLEY